jgi:hypothetical protein
MTPSEQSNGRDLGAVYNAVSEAYTGNLDADLSNHGLPPDLAIAVGRTCARWAYHMGAPPPIPAELAFAIGLMTGAEWQRCRS